MPYGTIKVDNITFTDNSVDKTVSLSGLIQNPTFTGNVTVTGTISGDVIRGGTTISGVTVTGTTANFASGVFTTQVSGATVIAPTGTFTSLTGTTATFTSGIIASGTAALPSLAILSDPNTGLFSPGADQLAISTNGTQQATIDSSGRLLVGTSTARSNFESVNSAGLQVESIGGAAGKNISLASNYNIGAGGQSNLIFARTRGATLNSMTAVQSGDFLGTINFQGADGTNFISAAEIQVAVDGTPGANDMPGRLVFSTTPDGSASPTERMRITSAGLVGLGTSTPNSLLSVASSSTTAYSATAFNNSRVYLYGGSATGAYNSIGFTNSAQSEGLIGFVQNASGYGDFVVQSYHGGYAEKLRITSAGLVGIGTTSPSTELHVAASSGYAELRLAGASGSGGSVEFFNSTTQLGDIFIDASNNMIFRNASEAFRVDSSRRLLVGTSSARSNFNNNLDGATLAQVEGTTFSTATISVTRNSNDTGSPAFEIVKTRGASNGQNTVVANGDPFGFVNFAGTDGTNPVRGASISAWCDGTPGANDMPGRLVFSTTADGGSSPTERMRITSAGLVGLGTTSWDLNGVSTKLGVQLAGTTGDGIAFLSTQNTANQYVAVGTQYAAGNTNNGSQVRFGIDSAGDTTTMIAFATANSGTPSEKMRLDRLGRLGIGTTSPQSLLSTGSSLGGQLGLSIDWTGGGGPYQVAGLTSDHTTGEIRHFAFTNYYHTFYSNNSEKARLDSSGRLLVGTSSVRTAAAYGAAGFQVESTYFANSSISAINNQATSDGSALMLGKSRGTSNGSSTIVQSGDTTGYISFQGTDGTALKETATIISQVDGTPGANDMPGRLVFSTTADGDPSPTERMRIGNDGRVFFGCINSPSASVFGTMISNSLLSEGNKSSVNTTSANVHWVFFNPNGAVGSISTSGSATAFNTSSDYRLKENIIPLTGAIDRLQQIPVHRFNFIADPDKTVDGFIAHEAQAVVPECVTGTKDAVDEDGNPVYQGIDQSKLVPLLTAALQEAIAKIEALETRLTALEGN